MTQEIIYTSAPRGLKPGSRGFCTVVSTSGLAKNLAERLEAISGYTHVFLPHDEHAALNPVVHSHLRLTVGGRAYHILSRIAAAGLDYTQRSNKLAHHVALDVGELPAAGPAWLLGAPGFMQTTWEGEPKILPRGRAVPSGEQPPGICHAWQKATGDAGWGGALAETAMTSPGRAAVIIFRPGMDLLPLLTESLALVPSNRRWQVTFSTYFTSLPPGTGCQWRCLLEGSVEAKSARRLPGALVINLCEPLGRAVGGQMVELARSGVPARAAAATMLEAVEPVVLPASAGPQPAAPPKQYAAAADTFRLTPPGLEIASICELKPRPKKRRRRRIWIWAAIAASLLILASGTFAAVTFVRNTRLTAAHLDNGTPPTTKQSSTSKLSPKVTVERSESDSKPKLKGPGARTAREDESKLADSRPQAAVPERSETAKQQPDKAQENSGDLGAPNSQPQPENASSSVDGPKSTPPAGSVTRVQVAVQLPAIVSGATEAPPASSIAQLATSEVIPIDADCELQLLGGDKLPDGRKFMLERVNKEDRAASWQVWLEPPRSAATAGRTAIAVIPISDGRVGFTWEAKSSRDFAERLRNCVLGITKPGHPVRLDVCLRLPQEVEPIQLNFTIDSAQHKLPEWQTAELPQDAGFMFEVTSVEAGVTPSPPTMNPAQTVSLGKEVAIRFDGEHNATALVATRYDRDENCIRWHTNVSWVEEEVTKRPLSPRSIENDLLVASKRIIGRIKRLNEQIGRRRTRLNGSGLTDKDRERLAQEINESEKEKEIAENDSAGLQSLGNILAAIHPYGRVHFRIFMKVEDVEVDLLRTKKTLPNTNQ